MFKNCTTLKPNLLNLLNNVTLFACITCTLFIICTCIRKFMEAPTTLSVKRVKISQVEFPEFTICPDLGSGYKIKLFDEYLEHGMENMSSWKSFDNFTLPLEEIVESIYFRYSNGYKSNFILSNSSEYAKISRITIESRYGKCATLQIPKRYFKKDNSLKGIKFYSLVKNLSIFTHYPGQYYNTPNPKVAVKMNMPLFIDFRFNLLHEIPGENCDPLLNGK